MAASGRKAALIGNVHQPLAQRPPGGVADRPASLTLEIEQIRELGDQGAIQGVAAGSRG